MLQNKALFPHDVEKRSMLIFILMSQIVIINLKSCHEDQVKVKLSLLSVLVKQSQVPKFATEISHLCCYCTLCESFREFWRVQWWATGWGNIVTLCSAQFESVEKKDKKNPTSSSSLTQVVLMLPKTLPASVSVIHEAAASIQAICSGRGVLTVTHRHKHTHIHELVLSLCPYAASGVSLPLCCSQTGLFTAASDTRPK